MQQQKEEIQKLINCGANINHTDKKGLSPILYFALKYNNEMVEFLKQCGAYSVSPINGETVFSAYELYRTYNSWLSKQTCKNISFSKNTFQLNYDKKKGKDSSFLSKKISFLGKMQTVSDFLYEMSWLKHSRDISQIEPSIVEKYFNSFGVCANFSGGNKYARQFISFCCFHVSEMFRQIQSIIPTKISIIDFSKLYKDPQLSDAIGVCYHSPDFKNNFPIRTVLFNSFETNKPNYWEHQFENQIKYHEENALSTKHFLSPFLHEFAHNVHFHKLYSKFGCPYANQGYIYNPKTQDLMTYLNLEIKDEFGNDVSNPCISYAARKALNTSSRYGSSRLPETFAEEFARTIVESMNLTTLRLTKNPFPMAKHNPTLQQVLYETWEGLIADGNGLI